MGKGLFVTATGTDVGKTFVSALIVKKLKEAGYCAGYYKAALSGATRTKGGFTPGDAVYVCQTAGLDEKAQDLVSYIYKNAYSPHLAAQIEGNPPEMSVIKSAYKRAASVYDFVTVEGSGGIMCPLRYDNVAHIFLEDVIAELGLGTIIVADAGLGTINSVVLTVEYIHRRQIPLKGVVLNRFHPGNVVELDNKKMIEEITGVPVIAFVEEDEKEIGIAVNDLRALYT